MNENENFLDKVLLSPKSVAFSPETYQSEDESKKVRESIYKLYDYADLIEELGEPSKAAQMRCHLDAIATNMTIGGGKKEHCRIWPICTNTQTF